jgi:mannose-6-phosphate isomerase-like protein (cupin superfamily)
MTDGSPHNGRRGVPKPWGWETLWTLTRRYAGKILHIRRGQQLALQYHREREESFLVRTGRVILVLEDARGQLRELWLGPGDAQHVPPGRLHRLIALEDCEVFTVSTPEIDDVEHVDERRERHDPPGLHSSAY